MIEFEIQWNHVGNILAVFLVISLVFETALSPLFNWRVFAQYCEGRGVKTPVTILAAVVLLWSYDIDIFQQLVTAFQNTAQSALESSEVTSSFFGRVITGFLVAGGSGAIFNIFSKLGLRNPAQLQQKAKEARSAAAVKEQSSNPPT